MEPLQEVNRLYDLENEYIDSFLSHDETYKKYRARLIQYDLKINQQMGKEFYNEYRALKNEFYSFLKEFMFKMGYLYAKSYPADETVNTEK